MSTVIIHHLFKLANAVLEKLSDFHAVNAIPFEVPDRDLLIGQNFCWHEVSYLIFVVTSIYKLHLLILVILTLLTELAFSECYNLLHN